MFLTKHRKSVRSRSTVGATAIQRGMSPLKAAPLRVCASGFTLLEMAFVVAIGMVVTTISVPMTKTALKAYHLSAAVSSVTGVIQSTRYQAISHGYHYNISFDPASQSYQMGSKVPPATTFSNVGTAIPWCSTGDVTMSPSTTLEFFPGGTVTATTGSMSFSLSNGTTTKTITVSGVGDVTVTP
jgi:Tfp pilus assembly protein FimT